MKNRFFVDGDVALIYLRHFCRLYRTAIDGADLPLAQALPGTWSLIRTSSGLRVRGSIQDPMTGSGSTTCYLHRLLTEAGPGVRVRHRDGNGLNNRRENLEIAGPGVREVELQEE